MLFVGGASIVRLFSRFFLFSFYLFCPNALLLILCLFIYFILTSFISSMFILILFFIFTFNFSMFILFLFLFIY